MADDGAPVAFEIEVDAAGPVTGQWYRTSAGGHAAVLLAHGAGAPQTHPFMRAFARGLADRGLDAATFNFVYMEQGRRAPDPKARLERCYQAAIATVRRLVPAARRRLVIGGKSMGGRIATQVVASADDGLGVSGLVSLGYPLHPPGRPEKRRDAHLGDIEVPILFVQGSRDTFGTEAEMRPVAEACRHATLHIVDGGDHSLKVRGKGAPSEDEVHARVLDVIAEWVRSH